MKGYNEKAVKEAGHTKPNKLADGPTRYTCPEYGKKIQYAKVDDSPLLSAKNIKQIQKLAGKFLYKGRTVDNHPPCFKRNKYSSYRSNNQNNEGSRTFISWITVHHTQKRK